MSTTTSPLVDLTAAAMVSKCNIEGACDTSVADECSLTFSDDSLDANVQSFNFSVTSLSEISADKLGDFSASPSKPKKELSNKKSLCFSHVEVRHYNVTCTGWVKKGPAVGLDWDCSTAKFQEINSYEKERPNRRGHSDLKLDKVKRTSILMNGFSYTVQDIKEFNAKFNPTARRANIPRRARSPVRPRQYSSSSKTTTVASSQSSSSMLARMLL